MHQPHQRLHRDLVLRAPAPALTTIDGTVMSVVYVTAQPTFTGVIGGLSTVTDNKSESSTDDSTDDSTESTSAISSSTRNIVTTTTTTSQTSHSQTSVSRTSTHALSSLVASTTASITATALLPSSTTYQNTYSSTAAAGASTTDTSSSSSTAGMSTGAKIGLGVGIILGIGLLAALVLLLLARKSKQKKQQAAAETEKRELGNQSVVTKPTTSATPNAPRLSLRPVSDLVPEFMGSKQKNRTSQGNMLTPISEAANARARNMSPSFANTQPRPLGGRPLNGDNPFRDPENPFADPEKGTGAPVVGNSTPVSPISTNAAVVGAAVAANAPVTNQRSSGPTVESFPLPQSQSPPMNAPTHSPRTGSAPAPIAIPGVTYAELPAAPSPVVAQGPGPDMPQSNVYRILMEFRPTMDDELELRAGQLVRMLHEYDDGWALCIRLDRSQQGVVPRTCLAAKPSKPRPGPPPTGSGSRPMTPQGRPRGPPPGPQGPSGPGVGSPRAQAPTPVRAESPATVSANTGAFNQSPRPLSPGPRPQPQKRSMSPGPYGAGGPKPMAPTQQRRRSNSASAASVRSKRNSPPGPSKLGPGAPQIRSDSPGLAI